MSNKARKWVVDGLEIIKVFNEPVVGPLRKNLILKNMRQSAVHQGGDAASDLYDAVDFLLSRQRIGQSVFCFSDFHKNKARRWMVFNDGSAVCLQRDHKAVVLTKDELIKSIEAIGTLFEHNNHWSGIIDDVESGFDHKSAGKLSPMQLINSLNEFANLDIKAGYMNTLKEFGEYVANIAMMKFNIGQKNKPVRMSI